MSDLKIVFSARAKKRFLQILDYLNKQHLSKEFTAAYISKFEQFLNLVLIQFPEAGTLLPKYGKDVRRITYQGYSFLYKLQGKRIVILTVYRENLP